MAHCTVLGVCGPAAVVAAVRRVHASGTRKLDVNAAAPGVPTGIGSGGERTYRSYAQVDGNLVVYDVWAGMKAVWSSGTPGRALRTAVMQADGNFVAHGFPAAYWATDTPGHGKCMTVMQDDGNLVIYQIQAPIWHSK